MKAKVALSADDLAEILEALHELRDATGDTLPTELEDRLLTAQRELDRARSKRQAAR